MIDLSWGASVSVPAGALDRKDLDPPGENVQGSEAWLKWRGRGIGSSDAAVLLGWSPWKNIQQLLDEKLGLWKPTFGFHQKKAMERGKELEPKIRAWYEFAVNALFPDAIATHPEHEFMRASFDGINSGIANEDKSVGRIIEIKAPNREDHELARNGMVPNKYVPQCQWLMMVGNIPWCDYVSYGSDGTYAIVQLKADPAIQAELKARAMTFWNHVQTKTPIMGWEKYERSYATALDLSETKPKDEPAQQELFEAQAEAAVSEQAIEALVAEALLCKDEAEQAQARYESKKERLKQILGSEKSKTCGEAVFGWQDRKGSVDYSVIPELIGLDLEQFRKPPTRAFYFKRKGEK